MERQDSRLRCSLSDGGGDLFFSLVGYRNDLFVSNNPKKIMEFYSSFKDENELVRWMKERPNGAAYLHEVDGDKEIIVVIPTADYEGEYAKRCREEVFKGLHIVFVESGNAPDPYFRLEHNINIGITKALEYNPKWIIYSNDDVYKIDDISVLKNQLVDFDPGQAQVIYVNPTSYHSYIARLSASRFSRNFILFVLGKLRRYQLSLEKKFNVSNFVSIEKPLYNFLFKKGPKLQVIGNFAILNGSIVRQMDGKIFDECYISGASDFDLSVEIKKKKMVAKSIAYCIGDYFGSYLGKNTPEGFKNLKGTPRRLRDVANMVYLNCKVQSRK